MSFFPRFSETRSVSSERNYDECHLGFQSRQSISFITPYNENYMVLSYHHFNNLQPGDPNLTLTLTQPPYGYIVQLNKCIMGQHKSTTQGGWGIRCKATLGIREGWEGVWWGRDVGIISVTHYLFVSLSQIAPFVLGMNLTLRGTGELGTPREIIIIIICNNNTIFIER